MRKFGLIGKKLEHSYSKIFFDKLFNDEQIEASYDLIELEDISLFENIKKQAYSGLSVTIPYKETIIPYLDALDDSAAEVGAVNAIYFKDNQAIGYNTDVTGFALSLSKLLVNKTVLENALVLGSGGAAKAIMYALEKLHINYTNVSRNPQTGQIDYSAINKKMLEDHKLIINCTPLGMYPNTDTFPQIPYAEINDSHILFDLVYNPAETLFLQKGKEKGATVCNGLEMLNFQALAAWEIWDEYKTLEVFK